MEVFHCTDGIPICHFRNELPPEWGPESREFPKGRPLLKGDHRKGDGFGRQLSEKDRSESSRPLAQSNHSFSPRNQLHPNLDSPVDREIHVRLDFRRTLITTSTTTHKTRASEAIRIQKKMEGPLDMGSGPKLEGAMACHE